MPDPRAYEGPFDPPPADCIEGAVAWRHLSEPDGPGRWRPRGWLIIRPNSLLEVGLDGIATREATLWAVPDA